MWFINVVLYDILISYLRTMFVHSTISCKRIGETLIVFMFIRKKYNLINRNYISKLKTKLRFQINLISSHNFISQTCSKFHALTTWIVLYYYKLGYTNYIKIFVILLYTI